MYENQITKAQLRQYRTKHKNIKRLCCASIYRDDYLPEVAGVVLECGDLTGNLEIKSDAEDDYPHNGVVYDAAQNFSAIWKAFNIYVKLTTNNK